MWYDESVIYQIYPFGYVGAPEKNDGALEHRILKIIDQTIIYLKYLNHSIPMIKISLEYCSEIKKNGYNMDYNI